MEDIKLTLIKKNNFDKNLLKKKRGKKVSTRKKREKTNLERVLKEIEDRKLTSADDIVGVLQKTKNTERSAQFFEQVIRAVVYNKSINLNNILNGRKFYYYLGNREFGLQSTIFTNDELYWRTRLYIEMNNTDKSLPDVLEFTNKTLCLQTLNNVQSDKYIKAFIDDQDMDFSIVGYDVFSDPVKVKMKQDKQIPTTTTGIKGDFTFNNKEYTYIFYSNGAYICYLKSKSFADVIGEYKSIKSKKKLEEGIRVYKIADKENVYISQDLKITNFWPCEVIFKNPLDYAFLYKAGMNMNKYEEIILKKMKEYDQNKINNLEIKDFLIYKNIVDFDTFELMINFLLIETKCNLKDVKYKSFNDKVDKFLEEWKAVRPSFKKVQLVIPPLLKLFDTFFCHFRNKIPLKYLEDLGKKNEKLAKNFEDVMNNEMGDEKNAFDILRDFIITYKLGDLMPTITNSLNKIIDMKDMFDQIMTLSKNVGEMVEIKLLERLEEIGNFIFGLYYFGNKEYNLQCINEIRTPALYLGNLLAGYKKYAKNLIEENEDKEREKMIMHDASIDEIIQRERISKRDGLIAGISYLIEEENEIPKGEVKNYKYIPNEKISNWFKKTGIVDKYIDSKFEADLVALGKMHMTSKTYKIPSRYNSLIKILDDQYTLFNSELALDKKANKLKTEKKILALKENLKEGNLEPIIEEGGEKEKEEEKEEFPIEEASDVDMGSGDEGGKKKKKSGTINIAPISIAGSEASAMSLRSGKKIEYKGAAAKRERTKTRSKRTRGVTFTAKSKKNDEEEEEEEEKVPKVVKRKKTKAK